MVILFILSAAVLALGLAVLLQRPAPTDEEAALRAAHLRLQARPGPGPAPGSTAMRAALLQERMAPPPARSRPAANRARHRVWRDRPA